MKPNNKKLCNENLMRLGGIKKEVPFRNYIVHLHFLIGYKTRLSSCTVQHVNILNLPPFDTSGRTVIYTIKRRNFVRGEVSNHERNIKLHSTGSKIKSKNEYMYSA